MTSLMTPLMTSLMTRGSLCPAGSEAGGGSRYASAAAFFEEEAGVGLNDGATFGTGFENFVRLNFGCPRSTLEEALHRRVVTRH